MPTYNMLSTLKENKILDSYQFLVSTSYKLEMVKFNYERIKELLKKWEENECGMVFEVTHEDNKIIKKFRGFNDNVNFLGQEVDRAVIVNKLVNESFSLLHSFFDNFAQFVNSAFLNVDTIDIKRCSIKNVIAKLSTLGLTEPIMMNIIDIENNDLYKYVEDFNNIVKHQYQIFTKMSVDILKNSIVSNAGNATIPSFEKGNNQYTEEEILEKLEKTIEYCENLQNDFINYILTQTNTIDTRIYNPKTHCQFKSKEDYEKRQNLDMGYHYIEVSDTNIEDEYGIMLVSDMKEEYVLEYYNCPYDFIVLLDETSGEKSFDAFLGYLKPIDGRNITIRDNKIIEYRKYKSYKIADNQQYLTDIISAMTTPNLTVHPLLSETTFVYIDEKTKENP